MRKVIGIILVAAGVFSLVYRGFEYQTKRRAAQLGPLEIELKKTEQVEIPVWAGVVMIVAGTGLLVLRR